MKKFLLIILLLAGISTSGKAQWYLGGGIGFYSGSNSPFAVSISPEAGYRFTNYLTAGGRFTYHSENNYFGIAPYARLYLLKPESRLRLAVSAHAPIGGTKDYFSYGFYFQPGISIMTGPHLRLECHFGAFGWGGYKQNGITTNTGWTAAINGNNTSVGVVFYR